MRFPKRSMVVAAAGLIFATAGVVSAGERDPARRMEKMEQRVVEKLGPSLGLDEAKSKELAGLLAASMQQRFAAMKTVKAERDQLRQLVERKAPANELDAQRARVEAAVEDVPSKLEVLSATGRLLNAEQQAQLALKLSGRHGKGDGKRQGKGHGRHGQCDHAAQ